MAVARMKLATIVGPLAHFDSFVTGCVVGREFHPESAAQVVRKVKGLLPFDSVNPYVEPLRHAERISDITGIELAFRPFESDGGHDLDMISRYFSAMENRFTALRNEKEELARRLSEDEQVLIQLTHLVGVNLPIHYFFTCTYVKFRFGRMPRDIFDKFFPLIKDRKDVYLFPTEVKKDYVYAMYMTPRAGSEQVDSLLASLQFDRIRLSERLEGSSEESEAAIRRDIEDCNRRLAQIDSETALLAAQETDMFLSYYSFVRYRCDAYSIRRYAAHTDESFYLLGWVPERDFARFEKDVSGFSDVNFILLGEDPEGLPDYQPPTKLNNFKLFRPFEPFVAMYGLPSYDETDPTPLMAISYPLIFGIMFGDLGQGALLILAGLLMWFLKKMWLGRVICYAGAASMFMGCVYGSLFGNEELLLFGFKVLHNSQSILQYSIWSGAGLVTLAIAINILNGIRQKNTEKKFFGTGGLAGAALYWGIVLIVLPFVGFGGPDINPMLILVCAVLPLIMVFLREPLAKLADRRRDWKPHEGTGNFILSNFFEMFEVMLSFLSNTLSFLRVGAYAISHASMMTVVYSLAQTAEGEHNIVVLIIGNLIVTGIEGLLVGIQVLRLEFYEMFGRFYNGGGRRYEPLKVDYKSKKE